MSPFRNVNTVLDVIAKMRHSNSFRQN